MPCRCSSKPGAAPSSTCPRPPGRLGYAFRTPYAAAKWGIIGFTQSLAKELGPANIRVNAILPGIVEGPRIESVIRARAKQLGLSYDEMEKHYLEQVSLRRMVRQQDVAAMVLFLLSPMGQNISGQSLGVDAQCRDAVGRKGRHDPYRACRNRPCRPRLGDQLRPRRP